MPLPRISALNRLDRPVLVATPVRVALGLILVLGGIAFIAFGAIFFFAPASVKAPHPAFAAFLFVAFIAFGAGFLFVGVRLLQIRSTTENLLSPSARRVASYFIFASALGIAAMAVARSSPCFAVNAAVVALVGYSLYRSARGLI